MGKEENESVTLNKAVHALALVPRHNRIEVLSRKAYSAMLWHAQRQASEQPGCTRFTVPLSEIMRTLGGVDSLKHVKAHLTDMVATVVEWNSPSGDSDIPVGGATSDAVAPERAPNKDKDKGHWKVSGLLACAELSKVAGELWVTWEYSGPLRQELIEPSRYAQIDLFVLSQLSTHTAVALYEICARYRSNPGGKTPAQPWGWWAPVLTGTPTADRTNFEYKVFKRDYLKKAIAQVNALTDIEVELLERKQGRQVKDLQFLVRQKAKALRSSPELNKAPAADLSLLERGLNLGLPKAALLAAMAKHDDNLVRQALHVLEKRLANTALSPLVDPAAYLETVLGNLSATAVDFVAGQCVPPAPVAELPPIAGVLVQALQAQPTPVAAPAATAISQTEAEARVRALRLSQARRALDEMDDAQLVQLAQLAVQTLQDKLVHAAPAAVKLMAPRIRRLQGSDLRLPRVLNELAEQQVRVMFGPQWDQLGDKPLWDARAEATV